MVALLLDSTASPEEVWTLMQHPDLEQAFGGHVPSLLEIRMDMRSRSRAIALVRRPSGEAVGFIGIEWLNPLCVKIAVAAIDAEDVRGKPGQEIGERFIDHLFKCGIIKIVGEIATTNRPSLLLAAAMGFKREGINRASIAAGDQIVDQVYVGLTRSEWHGLRG